MGLCASCETMRQQITRELLRNIAPCSILACEKEENEREEISLVLALRNAKNMEFFLSVHERKSFFSEAAHLGAHKQTASQPARGEVNFSFSPPF